jgi:predicted outer membrane protein
MAATASPGQAIANAAAASDAFEIATSQLAATNDASAAVKAFATKMITAHAESTAKLKTVAAAASPVLTPRSDADGRSAEEAGGPEGADRRFVRQGVCRGAGRRTPGDA